MNIPSKGDVDIDLLDIDFSVDESFPGTASKKNNRAAVRYVRDDISTYVSYKSFLGKTKTMAVKLLDITSKGASILTDEKFSINKSVILIFNFREGRQFNIKAKIIRHVSQKNEYGLKFESYNNDLGDYLLATQSNLIFR